VPVEQFAMLLTHLLLLQSIGLFTGHPLIAEKHLDAESAQ
jgi:hypothetical protein